MRANRCSAQALRRAIDCLPAHTREAMLAGISENEIIVGAYTDRRGGVCPMLAAHRSGGRTSLASFARTWDRYTNAAGGPRRATGRELRTLRAMLEASLMFSGEDIDLAAAVREQRAAMGRRERARPKHARPAARAGDRHRSSELAARPGWAWLRVFRRYDEFEAALSAAELQASEASEGREALAAR